MEQIRETVRVLSPEILKPPANGAAGPKAITTPISTSAQPISNAANESLASSSDGSMNDRSSSDRSSSAEQLDRLRKEEHLLACEQAVALVAETYGRDWDARERSIKSAAWSMALVDVAAPEILSLTQQVLRERTSPFPPVPADLLRELYGEDWTEDEGGKSTPVVVANPKAYQPLPPTKNELIEKGHLTPPLALVESGSPDPAEFKPGGKEHARTKAILSSRWAANMDGERDWEPETPAEAAVFRALNEALFDCCMMKTFSVKPRVRYEFGCWLLARFRVAQWTPQLASEQWQLWQQEKAERENETHAA